jgi:beta-lactamase regulating signal transducer with metallopeptidase domain
MNTLSLAAPAWFQTILNLSLQATLLAALVWLICKTLGRWIPPRFRALLWFIVIARVLVPFAPASPLSLQNIFARRIAPAVPPPARIVKIETNLFAEPLIHFEDAPLATAPAQPEPTAFPIAQTLAAIWLTGAILAFATIATRCWIIRRRLRSELHPHPQLDDPATANLSEIHAILNECRATLGLRYPIRLVVSKAVAAPALTGLYPATLIVPHAFQTGRFTQNQIRQILLHELAHIQQGHLWLHWLTLAARALHWFNPILHLAAARLRHECELAADAAALQNANQTERQSYGETILLALTQTTAAPTAMALGLAEQTAGLKQRLRALAEPRRRCFAPLGIALVTLVAITGLTSAETRPEQPLTFSYSYGVNRINVNITTNIERLASAAATAEVARSVDKSMLTNPFTHANPEFAATNLENGSLREFRYGTNSNGLYTRSFKIDTNTFIAGFQGVGINLTNNTSDSVPSGILTSQEGIQKLSVARSSGLLMELDSNRENFQRAVRQFFKIAGIAFEPPKAVQNPDQSQPAVYYNFDAGALFMRATLRDLDIAESALHAINTKSEVVSTNAQIAPTDPANPNDAPRQSGQDQAAQPVAQVAPAPAVIDNDQLHTRTFKLDTNVVMNALSRAGITPDSGPTPPDWQANWWNLPTSKSLIQYFERVGVSFQSLATTNTKAFFYDNRTGVLFVRANLRDIDRLEKALNKMRTEPLLISFAVQIIEAPAALASDLLKDFPTRPHSSTNQYLYATKDGTKAARVQGSNLIVESLDTPTSLTNVFVPAQETIIKRSAAAALIAKLHQAKGVEAITMPRVTTVLERQARISIEESRSFITEIFMRSGQPISTATGPKVDLIANAVTDQSLDYSEVLTITEFLGYNNSDTNRPMPLFRVRQTLSRVQLPHDCARVLIIPKQDKTRFPFIDRFPDVNRPFYFDQGSDGNSHIILFILPDIIDGYGNMVDMKP